jgi:hypothetical protein
MSTFAEANIGTELPTSTSMASESGAGVYRPRQRSRPRGVELRRAVG